MFKTAIVCALCVSMVSATVYFKEDFSAGWEDRWVVSEWKDKAEIGEWKATAGKFYGDKDNMGLKTGEDAKFYGLSAKMGSLFNNKDKDMILQYTVKNEQDIDCGGAYIKLLPKGLDQKKFGGDSEYGVMFGPDVCGTSTRKTHVILTYDKKEGKPTNYLHNGDVKVETDKFTHLYTLIVKPDNTYEVQIDGEKVEGGALAEKFDFLHPKQINDPAQSKPTDWVEEQKIPDPNEKKPDGYDDIPKQIPDPEASKPDDWDDEDDGEWEAPQIDNPEFKGDWNPTMIDNPAYKGEWEHPQIDNPDYFDDAELHNFCKDCEYVGFELWQVKAGTIFDNIIVTDSYDEAKANADESFYKYKDAEKKMDEEQVAEEKKKADEEAAAKKAEEDAKKPEEDSKDGDDDEDDDEDKKKEEL
jgi:calreticulin